DIGIFLFLRMDSGCFFPMNEYNLSGKQQSLPSFPRKWESRNAKLQEFIGNDRNSTNLNSRFRGNDGGVAGMTGVYQK
ncbi:hypothetical protein, partial [Neisseria meningitidis]|uniref:hypothetical protein n=1 Tax=Neisseria meningitidis TaxID=487 RepID=UPI001E348B37